MPTTFEARFVEALAALNETYPDNNMRVEELFGSFQTSIFGSARPSKYLPDPTEEQLREHIRVIHQTGMTTFLPPQLALHGQRGTYRRRP